MTKHYYTYLVPTEPFTVNFIPWEFHVCRIRSNLKTAFRKSAMFLYVICCYKSLFFENQRLENDKLCVKFLNLTQESAQSAKSARNFFEKYLLQKLKVFFQNFCVLNVSRVDF